jgi:hypothetical protein
VQKRKRNTVLRVGVALLPPPQAALARGSICPCHATEYWTRRSGHLATPTAIGTPLHCPEVAVDVLYLHVTCAAPAFT